MSLSRLHGVKISSKKRREEIGDMVNFQYHNPAKIVFGPGSEKELHRLLQEEKVSSLLMVYWLMT